MASPNNFSEQLEKRLLQSNKEEAFRFIDTIFSVAATKWPKELRQRVPQILEKVYETTDQNPPSNDSGQSGLTTAKEEKADEKKKKRCVIRLKIPALRENQASHVESDQKVEKKTLAENEEDQKARKTTAGQMMRTVSQQREADRTAKAALPTPVSDEDRLEESIRKLNQQYRAAQVNKRKIQMVEFQKNEIPSFGKAKAIPCSKEARKTIAPHSTLTSWIDKQAARRVW